MHDDLPPLNKRPDPASFQDNPFLENLFGMLCKDVYVLPGDTFVEQARRWACAMSAMAALKPRTPDEWLLASNVIRVQFTALHSLALYERAGAGKAKQKHGLTLVARGKAMQAAMRRYEQVRNLTAD